MRLIDADALIKELRDLADKNYEKTQCYMGIIAAIGRVQDATIAYDVEKVVGELLSKRERYRLGEIKALSKGEPLNVGVNLAKQASIEDCIEVVKRGGVE